LCFLCSDCETYISADDLRINLWNLEVSDQSFNIVDIKPVNMEDLTGTLLNLQWELSTSGDGWTELLRPPESILLLEGGVLEDWLLSKPTIHCGFVCVLMEQAEVITSAEFHPTHCNMLAYSSSKGSIRLIDMRQSALCDRHSKLYGATSQSNDASPFGSFLHISGTN